MALEYLEKAQDLDPTGLFGRLSEVSIVAIKSRRDLFVSSEEFTKSLDFLETVINDPSKSNIEFVWLLRAWIYGASCFIAYKDSDLKQFADLEKAKQSFTRILNRKRRVTVGMLNFYGSLLLMTGQHQAAAQTFTRCLKFEKNPNIYYNRGMAYYKTGNFKAAIRDFEIFLSKNPNHQKALSYLKESRELLQNK